MTVGLSEGQGLPPKQAETGGAPRPQSRDALGAGRLGVQAGSRVQPWATQLQQLSQPSIPISLDQLDQVLPLFPVLRGGT